MEFRSNSIEVGNRMKPSSNETVFRCKFLLFFNVNLRPIQTYIQCEASKNSLEIPKDYSGAISRKTDHIMTKRKMINNDSQNATQETRLSNMNLTKTRDELMCFFRVSSSCSTGGTHRGTLAAHPVKNHEWRTGLWLGQTKHIRGHLWHKYSQRLTKPTHILSFWPHM
jgi:hypothetical protein